MAYLASWTGSQFVSLQRLAPKPSSASPVHRLLLRRSVWRTEQKRLPPQRFFASGKHSGPSLTRTIRQTRGIAPRPQSYLPNQALYAQTLASKHSPTLLYEAPTSNVYAVTCYGISGFCMLYGVWHFYDALLTPHPGLWWVIPYFMGGVCIFTIGAGVYVAAGVRRLVKSVTAVPITNAGGRDLLIRLEARSMLPWVSGKVVEVSPEQLTLASRVAVANESAENSLASKRFDSHRTRAEAELLRKKEREYELDHIMTKPFRDIGRGLNGFLSSVGRILLREGFVKMFVNGKQVWRMDAQFGWAMDNGNGELPFSTSITSSDSLLSAGPTFEDTLLNTGVTHYASSAY